MTMTDPISDMLTRVRNALQAKHATVDIPSSGIKKEIARILKEEGYIKGYSIVKVGNWPFVRITLKYSPSKQRVISNLKRISKPGIRRYVTRDGLPEVLGGLGIAIVSTSKGVMTGKKARSLGIGGEVLCTIF